MSVVKQTAHDTMGHLIADSLKREHMKIVRERSPQRHERGGAREIETKTSYVSNLNLSPRNPRHTREQPKMMFARVSLDQLRRNTANSAQDEEVKQSKMTTREQISCREIIEVEDVDAVEKL